VSLNCPTTPIRPFGKSRTEHPFLVGALLSTIAIKVLQPILREKNDMGRIQSGLGLLGITGSIAWISLILLMAAGWGPPGSGEYERYEANSQLWVFAFALMACGFIGLSLRYRITAGSELGFTAILATVFGFVLMMAGNVAEFSFFTDLPYEAGNARMWSWLTFLLGFLTVLVALVLLGVWTRRHELLPRWAGWVFLLALPASFVAGVLSLYPLPLCLAALVVGILSVRQRPLRHGVSVPAKDMRMP
jgi:hypothetical protein